MQSHLSGSYLTSRVRTGSDDSTGRSVSTNSGQASNSKSEHPRTWIPRMSIPLAPGLFDFAVAISLVFGGCCTNAWTLERVLSETPSIGTTLSFLQMLFITLQSLPSVIQWNQPKWCRVPLPSLKPRQIPLSVWTLQVVLVSAISVLNNLTFRYKLPLSIQIVLRSAGLIVSMLLGFVFSSKRYNGTQLLAAIMVTFGVIATTTSKSSSSTTSQTDPKEYLLGIICLALSLLGSGLLGLLQERAFAKYGPHWKEGVFYNHAMSLPILSFMWSEIADGWHALANSTSDNTPFFGVSTLHIILALNVITQAVCVSSVNNLTSQVTSVTTNLVLTARKAASLCLSVWWFGSGVSTNLAVGATMVFAGTVLYAQASSALASAPKTKKTE